jgi:23S rRNA pseudouridine1911/1915/1917 synthase
MPKPKFIELDEEQIPILFEDRSVLAIDKPPGWMLVPFSWQRTSRNLQAALVSSIASGAFWARSRNLKFIRFVHRLDAETSGILLLAKSPGALETLGRLFESRQMQKLYLAVVLGVPRQPQWICRAKIGPDKIGRMRVDPRLGKEAETEFRLVHTQPHAELGPISLIEARPVTGRTHQIRVHLKESGLPIAGDELYGKASSEKADGGGRAEPSAGPGEKFTLGLRAVELAYRDPFTKRPVRISAPRDEFLKAYGFKS